MTQQDQDIINELIQQYDDISLNHAISSQQLAEVYEQEMNRPNNLLSTCCLASDLGKTYIAPAILNKTETLDEVERAVVNAHPYFTYMLLIQNNISNDICQIVLYHHLYTPPHLSSIPDFDKQYSKIVSELNTIDRFAALTEVRPFRDAYSIEEALNIIEESEYDNDVDDFLRRYYL